MINKPKPLAEVDMEAIFRRAKVEQENADKAFEEEQKTSAKITANLNSEIGSIVDSKSKRGSKKAVKLTKGSTVRIISGSFSGFEGTLKKLSHKTKMVSFNLH